MNVWWRFFKYRSSTGADPFGEWQEEFADAWEELRTRLIYLRKLPREEWRRPDFDVVRGKVCEHRFKVQGRAYRPLGAFGPERQCYTFLVGCHKKMNLYVPPSAKETAQKRWKDLENGRASAEEISLEES